MKIKTYTDDLYNVHITLYAGTWESFLKEMKKEGLEILFEETIKDTILNPLGFHLFIPHLSRAIIFVTQKKNIFDLRTFVHELNHVCLAIFDRCGIKVDSDNSEPYCYYFDYIFGKFIK